MSKDLSKKLLGALGEAAAAEYLKKNGYKVIAANYSCIYGEIDIVARKRELLVIVEVKTRKSTAWAEAAEYVDAVKQNRLRRSAHSWLTQYGGDFGLSGDECRFDIIEVYVGDDERSVRRINHIVEAF